MTASRTTTNRLSAEPNVVPMIDILLVLLIIFMLASVVDRKMISAQLPPETSTSGDAESIVLDVGPGGTYSLNRSPVLGGTLPSRLRALYAARPTKTIFIRGDPRATYQDVVLINGVRLD